MIVAEGQNDKNYIDSLYQNKFIDNKSFDLNFIICNPNDSKHLNKKVTEAQNNTQKTFDKIFYVFDSKNLHVENILKLSKNRNIDCIISNPGLEIWFWWHFEDYPSNLSLAEQAIKENFHKKYQYDDLFDIAKIRHAINNNKKYATCFKSSDMPTLLSYFGIK